MIARVVAFVAAVTMVVVAIVIRNNIDDDDRRSGFRLTCIPEAVEACEDGGTVEPAGTTADRLIAEQSPRLDGWVTTEPWPRIVDEARQRAGLTPIFQATTPLARTRAAVLIWRDRAAVLARQCGETLDWKCLGEAAQRGRWSALGGREEWGVVKLGIDDPATSAAGLTVLGSVAAALGGGANVSSTDLQANEAFQRWITAVARTVVGPANVETMLSGGPAVQDAALALDSQIGRLVRSSARRNDLVVLYPAPVATANLVLATRASSGPVLVAPPSWSAPEGGTLPAPGVLDYLRTAWREAR